MPITGPAMRILRHATHDVRMVMLHRDQRHRLLHRPLRRHISGMKIVSDDFWLDLESPLQMLQCLDEKFQARKIFKVPKMLALVGIFS